MKNKRWREGYKNCFLGQIIVRFVLNYVENSTPKARGYYGGRF